MPFGAGPLHTEPVTGWPFLIVLNATPVPPVTLPVILIRVAPVAHLPLVVWLAKWMLAFVVPLPAAHLSVMFSVPDGAPGGALVKVPVPFPPVAPSGVQ